MRSEHGFIFLTVLGLGLSLLFSTFLFARIVNRALAESRAQSWNERANDLAQTAQVKAVQSYLSTRTLPESTLLPANTVAEIGVIRNASPQLVAVRTSSWFAAVDAFRSGIFTISVLPRLNWSLASQFRRKDCARWNNPIESGSLLANVSAATCENNIDESDGSSFTPGNYRTENLLLRTDPTTTTRFVVKGSASITELNVASAGASKLELVAVGDLKITTLRLPPNGSQIFVSSALGRVNIEHIEPAPELCVGGVSSSDVARISVQSGRETILRGVEVSKAGTFGCPYDRDAPFWNKLQLVGERVG